MKDPERPSSRRLARAGLWVAVLFFVVLIAIYVGRYAYHIDEPPSEQPNRADFSNSAE